VKGDTYIFIVCFLSVETHKFAAFITIRNCKIWSCSSGRL